MLQKTFPKPYYAVIFTSCRTQEEAGYAQTAEKMMQEVQRQEGFLGADSWRDAQGCGVTISYWASMDSIARWRDHLLHSEAKEQGRNKWYSQYVIRICRVEQDNLFDPSAQALQ